MTFKVPSNQQSSGLSGKRSTLFQKFGFYGLILSAIVESLVGCVTAQSPLINRMSRGERILFKQDKNVEDKALASDAVSQNKGLEAIQAFQAILNRNRNDPESLIYLNNLKATQDSNQSFAIGVSVPISINPNIAQEILRGVAQAQDELNHAGGVAGRRMQVTIADDGNDPNVAMEIAKVFSKNEAILGIVGHNSSEASLAAAQVYQSNQLVMISPTSGSDRLTSFGSYVFRTIPRTNFFANPLVKYVTSQFPNKRVGLCQDSKSSDNLSFRDDFVANFVGEGGQIVSLDCELSDPSFDAQAIINRASREQLDAILICPHVDRIDRVLAFAQVNQGRIPLLSSQTMYTSQTLTGGNNVMGLVMPVFWHPGLNPDFAQSSMKYWSGPVNWRTATAYDATLAIIKAVSSSTHPTRSDVQSTLRSGRFTTTGSTGEVRFMETGDRAGIPILMTVKKSTTGFSFIPIESTTAQDSTNRSNDKLRTLN